jgi:hypothetical protein
MKYIIERPLQTFGAETVLSYLIDSQKITYVSQSPLRLNVMKMSMNGLKMIPGFITSLRNVNTLRREEVKLRIHEKVKQGTTTLLASAKINCIREADHELKKTRHQLISSPIDYCIGLSTTPERLNPEMVRYCRKKKIAFIELECEHFNQLQSVIWERIVEANFPYRAVIIVKFPEKTEEKLRRVWQEKWNILAQNKGIPTFSKELQEDDPIPLPYLKLLGVYPLKGGLFSGSDADYSLISNISGVVAPNTVVVRGTIVYSETEKEKKQGFGKEITIVQPRRFGENPLSRV